LWSYWIDETAADVYGLLNLGPAFAFNLAAFLTAFRAETSGSGLLKSAMSQPGGDLDVHPVDVLRLHVLAGVIESLTDLDRECVNAYLADLDQLIKHCDTRPGDVIVNGYVEIDRHRWVGLDQTISMAEAILAARRVGSYLSTTRLSAFGGHTIQEIETWTNSDESAAVGIKKALLQGKRVVAMGDDAQLLAGATLALLERPQQYSAVNEALANALDDSYARDPIMGFGCPHPLVAKAFLRHSAPPNPDDPTEGTLPTGIAGPSKPKPGDKSTHKPTSP
jgi:hypothetical protein